MKRLWLSKSNIRIQRLALPSVLKCISLVQTEREEKMAEVRAMRKQEREFNRKKEYARRCRIQVSTTPPHTSLSFSICVIVS